MIKALSTKWVSKDKAYNRRAAKKIMAVFNAKTGTNFNPGDFAEWYDQSFKSRGLEFTKVMKEYLGPKTYKFYDQQDKLIFKLLYELGIFKNKIINKVDLSIDYDN